MAQANQQVEIAKGSPSKGLFIYMLTRDISLSDCITDLLDNGVDGIANYRRRGGAPPINGAKYKGFNVEVEFNKTEFRVKDDCGGIPISVAKEYAFRFGRPEEATQDLAEAHTIGLYGIGMKRAMFKMGKRITVSSSTGDESFDMPLDVDQWRAKPENDWDFELHNVVHHGTSVPVGTTLAVSELYRPVSREYDTPAFGNSLIHALRRQYAFILNNGLKLKVNKHAIIGIMPTFKVADELKPFKARESYEGVSIEITAGLSSPPPEDDSAESAYPEMENYGWYVVCNGRVVVTADKTQLTGWGITPVPAWHPQFNGFLGVASFESDDPRKLPWTTTKRDVNEGSEVYRRAMRLMSECAKQFTDYTNKRKSEVTRAKKVEGSAQAFTIDKVGMSSKMVLPSIKKRKVRRICYEKPVSEIENVASALGLSKVSLKEVGIKTFDYFREREVGG
jgi:transcriptional regulator NrdR family protein